MADLVYSLGGDVSLFEQAMLKAVTLSKTSTGQMTSYFQTASKAIDAQLGTNITGSIQGALGSVGKLSTALGALKIAAGAFVAFEAMREAVSLVGEAADAATKKLDHLVEIGDKARQLGVSTNFLQAFQADSKLYGMTPDQANDALSHARDALSNNLQEGDKGAAFTSTAGDRVHQDVLAGNLPGVSDQQLANASTYQAKMQVILDLIDQMEAKGENLAAIDLADKIFGSNTSNALRDGVLTTDQLRQNMEGVTKAADDTIASTENIAEAQRISAEITDQNNRLAQEWKGWNDEILSIELEIKGALTDLRGVYVDLVEWTDTWLGKLEGVAGRIGAIMTQIGNSSVFANFNSLLDRYGMLDHSLGPIKPGAIPGVAGDEAYNHPLTITPKDAPLPPSRPQNVGDTSRRLPSLNAGGGGGGGGAKTDEVDNYIKSLAKSVAAEKGEADAIGLSNAKKQEAIDLAKAQEAAQQRGTPLTADETKKVISLADAYAKYKDAVAAANVAKEIKTGYSDLGLSSDQQQVQQKIRSSGLDQGSAQAKDLASQLTQLQELTEAKADTNTFVKGLVGDLIAGKSAAAALSDELLKLGGKLLDKGIDTLISGAFAGATATFNPLAWVPHFAGGTSSAPGGPALVGEDGPEIVNLPRGASVLPNAATMRAIARNVGSVQTIRQSPQGGMVNVTHAPTYNVTPAKGVTPEQLAAVIDRNNQQFAKQLGPMIIDANRRSSTRIF